MMVISDISKHSVPGQFNSFFFYIGGKEDRKMPISSFVPTVLIDICSISYADPML